MKIYIIGPVGSGKTTFSKKLEKQYHIKSYELDRIVWDDEAGKKRDKKEIDEIFHTIIQKKNWIIEDVGRKCFIDGVRKADIVYYLNLPFIIVFYRCIRRWIRQRLGKEEVSYAPSINMLFRMIYWALKNCFHKKKKIKWIRENNSNLKVLRYKSY